LQITTILSTPQHFESLTSHSSRPFG
jgi:hypothetical protein